MSSIPEDQDVLFLPGRPAGGQRGLRLAEARAVAATGVDFFAVGALTHSSPALDLGLDLLPS